MKQLESLAQGFESHIAALIPFAQQHDVLKEFLALHPEYVNIFLAVHNSSPDVITPDVAIGHDLPLNKEGLYVMLTYIDTSLEAIINKTRQSLSIMGKYGLPINNFEIEELFPKKAKGNPYRKIIGQFPGYKRAGKIPGKIPNTEVHFQLEGRGKDIASNDEIMAFLERLGIRVNQIVDFSTDIKSPEDILTTQHDSPIYRVGTSFQKTVREAYEKYEILKNQSDPKYPFKLTVERLLGVGVPL